MNPLTAVNAIANAVVVIAVVNIAISVFGNPYHPIHSHKTALITRKFVSSIVICGALSNIITLSTPSWTEVLLNVGFSINYCWSCYYDSITSTKHSKISREIPRVNSSGGNGCAGTGKANSSASRPRRKRPASR